MPKKHQPGEISSYQRSHLCHHGHVHPTIILEPRVHDEEYYSRENRESRRLSSVARLELGKEQRAVNHATRHEAAVERRIHRYENNRQYFIDYWHSPRGKQISRYHNAIYQCNKRAGGCLDLPAFYAKCETLEWHCQICGKVLTKETVTIDHIIPVSKGGTNDIENLQPMCRSCNSRKGNRPMSNYIVNTSFTITPTIPRESD